MAKQIVPVVRFCAGVNQLADAVKVPTANTMAPLTEATPGRRFSGHNSRPLPGTTSTAILVEVHHHAIPTGFSTED